MKTIKISILYPINRITAPLVSMLIRTYNLEVNILHADISPIKTGTLVADITGQDEDVDNALLYIEAQGVEYKIFNRKLIWNEDDCVHCGACTGVCPSDALSMGEASGWTLEFDKEKCLVCGLCTKACPLGVMSLQ